MCAAPLLPHADENLALVDADAGATWEALLAVLEVSAFHRHCRRLTRASGWAEWGTSSKPGLHDSLEIRSSTSNLSAGTAAVRGLSATAGRTESWLGAWDSPLAMGGAIATDREVDFAVMFEEQADVFRLDAAA